jgi:iron complex outermembrane recepter protein
MSRHSEIAHLIRHVLAVGAVTVAGGVVAVHAQEQAQSASEQTLQTVVVTGSMIKRTDFETPSPVQVVTAEDLQQSGFTSVSEVLRNLSANGQGTLSQSFNQAFAGGGSGVALRGLTVGATLTLIDGERMIPYPLSDDGQRNFVDVSSIPMIAVERIDVLKDGASAEYGSDAIAGVVNIIMKKSFNGVQVSGEAGQSQKNDGFTDHFSALFGTGDLASDGYNAYLAVELRHQDPIYLANRSGLWTEQNWSAFGGYNNLPGAGSSNPGAGSSNPLNPISVPLGGYLVNPAVGALDPSSVFLGNCNYNAYIANQCTYGVPGRFQIQPQTGNTNVIGRLTKNLGGDWQAVVTGSLFRSEAEQIGGLTVIEPEPTQNIIFNPSLTYSGPQLGPVIPPITVPANYPGNTFGVPTQIAIPMTDVGQFSDQFVTNTYRLFGDLRGSAAGWDLDFSLGLMYAALTQKMYGIVNLSALQTSVNNGYVFNSGGPALNQFAPEQEVTDTDALQVLDLRATRELLQLPGGALSLAAGTGLYHIYKDSLAPPEIADGITAGNNAFAVGGEDNANAYLEFVAPVIKGLEIDGAGRWDHFNSFGSAVTPKFGLKYTPFQMLTLRGTYGKGFRAPNTAEAGTNGAAFGGFSGTDPTLCPNPGNPQSAGNFPSQCLIYPTGVQTRGTDLQPEKSTNYTFGAIVRPVDQLTVSIDYWDIKINQDIQSGVNAFFLGDNPALFPYVRGPQVTLPECTNTVTAPGATCTTANVLTPVGPYAYQLFPYVNFSETHVNGLDVDLAAHFDIGAAGRLTTSFNATHVFHYMFGFTGSLVDLAGTHGPEIISGDTGNPKNRFTSSLAWDRGPLNLTLSVNYVGSFTLTDPSIGIDTCAEAVNSNYDRFVTVPTNLNQNYCVVRHFTTTELYGQYAFTNRLSVHAAIQNLFNTQPPLDLQTYGAAGNAPYNPAMAQEGAVGRFFNVGATYTF